MMGVRAIGIILAPVGFGGAQLERGDGRPAAAAGFGAEGP